MENEKNNSIPQDQAEPKKCKWCEQEIKQESSKQEFLTGVFGYEYCSEECMQDHICSK